MRKIIIYIILIIAIIWLFITLKKEYTKPIETIRVETTPQEIEEDIYNLILEPNELSL